MNEKTIDLVIYFLLIHILDECSFSIFQFVSIFVCDSVIRGGVGGDERTKCDVRGTMSSWIFVACYAHVCVCLCLLIKLFQRICPACIDFSQTPVTLSSQGL